MVNTSPAAAVYMNEEKRRKMSTERAKANHLLRQLQMRLQYARLKVDHGWQKQSLNEVENLYFTHSTIRGSRPQNNSSTLLPVTVRDLQPKPASDSSLSFSFKTGGLAKRDSLAMSVDQDTPALPALQPSPELIPSTPSTTNSTQTHTPATGIPLVASIPTATPNLSPAPPPSTSPNGTTKKAADAEDPYGFKSSNASLTYDSFWATTSSKASSSFKGKAAA